MLNAKLQFWCVRQDFLEHQNVWLLYIWRENLKLDRIMSFSLTESTASGYWTPHVCTYLHMFCSFISVSASIRPPEHAASLSLAYQSSEPGVPEAESWVFELTGWHRWFPRMKKYVAQPCPKSHYICHWVLFSVFEEGVWKSC